MGRRIRNIAKPSFFGAVAGAVAALILIAVGNSLGDPLGTLLAIGLTVIMAGIGAYACCAMAMTDESADKELAEEFVEK